MKALARKVKASRARSGKRQADVAAKVLKPDGRAYSRAWLAAIEKGSAQNVPAEAITALAIELGDDPHEYLRLAGGRAVLQSAGVIPAAPLDPRISAEIEAAVDRAVARVLLRLQDRLEGAVGAAILQKRGSSKGLEAPVPPRGSEE